MKNIFKILSFSLGLLIISGTYSCSFSKHSFRVSEIPDKNVVVADKISVELRVDENKVIQASSSRSHKSAQDAKNEAYYNAITNNNIHVLVDPIYKTVTSAKILIFGGKSTSTVTGFAGYYENPKSYKETLDALEAEKNKKDQETFDFAIKQMKQLKEDGYFKPSTSSKVSSERIINLDKISNIESLKLTSPISLEVEYELTKTTTTSSLVDEYKEFLKGINNPTSMTTNNMEGDEIVDNKQEVDNKKQEKEKVSILKKILGKGKAILKKIPLIGKLFTKK
jgi:hypothetical protein